MTSSSLLPPPLFLPSFGPQTTSWSSGRVRSQQHFPLGPITRCVDEESNLTALCDPSRVFGLDIQGRDCGDEAAQWFTNFLKTEAFRLVQFEKNMKGRPSSEIFPSVDQKYTTGSVCTSLCECFSQLEGSWGDIYEGIQGRLWTPRPTVLV